MRIRISKNTTNPGENKIELRQFNGKEQGQMNIRPLADKVLVERVEAESKTAGGIVLPDTAKEKPQKGKVVSVGEGKRLDDGTRREVQVKKGDLVLFTSYAGTEIKVEGKEYLIMDESDIMAVIEK
jgi:chaperonin GroES